jgi:hypothetical protein
VALSRRYRPEKPPSESSSFGLDYSFVIPVGVGIKSGTLAIYTNTASPAPADADFDIGPVYVRGRAIWANLRGGVSGTDYLLEWSAVDTLGNVWPRTCLLLCAKTS